MIFHMFREDIRSDLMGTTRIAMCGQAHVRPVFGDNYITLWFDLVTCEECFRIQDDIELREEYGFPAKTP